MKEQIGIVGAGVVGGALGNVLAARYDVRYLDPAKGLLDDLEQCEVVFVRADSVEGRPHRPRPSPRRHAGDPWREDRRNPVHRANRDN